jgi:hypothetical protein
MILSETHLIKSIDPEAAGVLGSRIAIAQPGSRIAIARPTEKASLRSPGEGALPPNPTPGAVPSVAHRGPEL